MATRPRSSDPCSQVTYQIEFIPPPAPATRPGAPLSPLAPLDAAPHPFMSRFSSTMHEDAQASDVSGQSGVLGNRPATRYFELGRASGMCPTFVFDDEGRALTIGFTAACTQVMRLDPGSLEVVGSTPVPRRKGTVILFLVDPNAIFQSTSGGAYLFCDNRDCIVVPTANREIWIIAQVQRDGAYALETIDKLDLRRGEAVPQGIPAGDQLTATLPDWHQQGLYWFTSANGLVGTVQRQTGHVCTVALCTPETGQAEKIENSFAVGPDGAFIVSDHALYRFTAASTGEPQQAWRAIYDRGIEKKPGQISLGSGTTPTLLGQFVAIGDNADIMNVCVYGRDDGTPASLTPVFTSSGSACENSFVGYNGSLIVGNTYGYISPYDPNSDQQGGLTRLDIDAGSGQATVVWNGNTDIMSSATPKLAVGTGLVYCYTKQQIDGADTWCVVGVDFHTGDKALVVPIAEPAVVQVPPVGPTLFCYDRFDNGWGPIAIGLDEWGDPSLFIGMIEGFLQVADTGNS